MREADQALKFEIAPDIYPDANSVAHALTSYVEVLREAASILDPNSAFVVELIGVEPGSQIFKLALRKIEQAAARVKDGGEDFPHVFNAAIALAALVATTALTVVLTNELTPDPRIPADQMAIFNQMNRELAESVALQRKTMKFFGDLQHEPAFSGIKVLRDNRVLAYEIPRSEFAARSGLWSGGDEVTTPATEKRLSVWDVVLLKAVLESKPRRWTFAKDGLKFSAVMSDPAILEAIRLKTLPIQVAEGVTMKIEVSYNEHLEGDAWVPISDSYKVTRVIHPRPTLPSVGLFAAPDRP